MKEKRKILSQDEIDALLIGGEGTFEEKLKKVREMRKNSHWHPTHEDYAEFKTKEWPFDNYSQQLERLESFLGKIVYFTEDLVNSNYGKLVDIIDMRKTKGINQRLFEPNNQEQIFPHSVLFETGEGLNLRLIAVIMQGNFDILKDTTIKNMGEFDFYRDNEKTIFFNPIQVKYWTDYFYKDNI